MKRVSVYVDGFNLYYAIRELKKNHLKWVDIWALSETLVRADESVSVVKYFSAYAKWNDPSYRRHQRYVDALELKGVNFIEGNFKKKTCKCRICKNSYQTHEEKETDVNIGAHLLADACLDRFDRALVISADSDLNQAVNLAKNETTNKQIDIISPPGRKRRNSAAVYEIPKSKLEKTLFSPEIVESILRKG